MHEKDLAIAVCRRQKIRDFFVKHPHAEYATKDIEREVFKEDVSITPSAILFHLHAMCMGEDAFLKCRNRQVSLHSNKRLFYFRRKF